MTGLWALADVALADIEINGAFYPTVSAAVAAAAPGDTLVFDGGTYEASDVDLGGRSLVFQGNGSTLTDVGSVAGMILLSGGSALQATDLTFQSTTDRAILGASGASLNLSNSTLQTVITNDNGGGIKMDEPSGLTLTDVVFDGTSAQGASPNGRGGGLWVSGATSQVVLDGVVFDATYGNTRGGAVYAEDTDLRCVDCRFLGTSSTGDGGAIYATGTGAVALERCAFEATSASSGGALHTAVPTTVIESSFCGTAATGDGGAIYSTAGGGSVHNSVFLDTEAADGGAMRLRVGGWAVTNNHVMSVTGPEAVLLDGPHTVTNTLFAFNAAAGISAVGGLTHHHNAYWASNPSVTGGVGATDVVADPLLAGFIDDGICGNDQLWPGFGSPLLDAGDPALQDPDGGPSDIGAFGGPDADPTVFDDADGDGFPFLEDCDDAEPASHPAPLADEVCDGVDNDCSGGVDDNPDTFPTWFQDCDGDGQGDLSTAVTQCDPPPAPCTWGDDGSDCDDTDPARFVGAPEHCDDVDADCDGTVGLEELGVTGGGTYYVDADGDGAGDAARDVQACSTLPGLSDTADDCDDAAADVYPGAPDTCGDGVDTDCSGVDGALGTDATWFPDLDRDGFGDREAPGVVDCQEPPGGPWVVDASDCDDTTALVRPLAAEVCDGVDQDCDDVTDDVEGVEPTRWYPDGDGDGFGDDAGAEDHVCDPPAGLVDRGGDCDDADGDVHPGADERCDDAVDDDCDGVPDDGCAPEPTDPTDPTDPPTTTPTPTKGEEGGCACDQSPARAGALAPIALGIAWGRRRRGPTRQESRGLAKVVVAKGGK
jgi:predicted outer membrane repeat protein